MKENLDLDKERSRWWSGSKKTGHWEMERAVRTTTERDGRERQMETEEGGGRGVCCSCWCHWGSDVETAVCCSTAWRSKPVGTCAPWEALLTAEPRMVVVMRTWEWGIMEGAGERQVGKQQGIRLQHNITLKGSRTQTRAFEMFPARSRQHVKEPIIQGFYGHFLIHDVFSPARLLLFNQWHQTDQIRPTDIKLIIIILSWQQTWHFLTFFCSKCLQKKIFVQIYHPAATKETNVDPVKMDTKPERLHLILSSFVAVTINPQRTFELIKATVPIIQKKKRWVTDLLSIFIRFRTRCNNHVHAGALLNKHKPPEPNGVIKYKMFPWRLRACFFNWLCAAMITPIIQQPYCL